jgi:hypothetical protein
MGNELALRAATSDESFACGRVEGSVPLARAEAGETLRVVGLSSRRSANGAGSYRCVGRALGAARPEALSGFQGPL